MNVTYMVFELDLRVKDAKRIKFSDDAKLDALNNAQDRACRQLRSEYLTQLEVKETSLTATNGEYAFGSLAFSVLKGAQGILKVKINGGDYCTIIDVADLKSQENQFLAGSTNNPIAYIFDEKIYVVNGETSPTIDVYYLRQPNKMIFKLNISASDTAATTTFLVDAEHVMSVVDDTYINLAVHCQGKNENFLITGYDATGNDEGEQLFTVSPAADANFGDDVIYFVRTPELDSITAPLPDTTDPDLSVETCDLDFFLHEIVISLAESDLWAMDGQKAQHDAALAFAKLLIDALNARFVTPEGIGANDQRRAKINA